jgi:ADP-heptose:LPS heptosyltransferase
VALTPLALVLRAAGLGDLLVIVPALRGLRRQLPGHHLILATSASLTPVVDCIGGVDSVLDTHSLSQLPWHGPGPAVAVNLHGKGPESHQLLAALRPERLVAYACPPEFGFGPEYRAEEHEVERWCRLVEAGFGGSCDRADLDLLPPSTASPVRDAVVIHPGASHGSRRWPAERFALVAAALTADGCRVVVTGSAAERSLAARVAALAGLPESSVLAGRMPLEALLALVAHARLVVCGDTGVAHVATAYRRPSVVLYGPTAPARWGPPPDRGQHVVLWRGRGDGNPWGNTLDPALAAIPAEDVVTSARSLLARFEAPHRVRDS